MRPASVESRFEALHTTGLTALVGREEETRNPAAAVVKGEAGEGQVVLLSGEAGIGKSRLTGALMERLEGEPHTRLRYFCSPQHTDPRKRPLLVGTGELAISGYIRRKNGCELPPWQPPFYH